MLRYEGRQRPYQPKWARSADDRNPVTSYRYRGNAQFLRKLHWEADRFKRAGIVPRGSEFLLGGAGWGKTEAIGFRESSEH